MPAAIGRVLGVLRKLIDIGRQLAGAVQQRAAAPGFALFARRFGTADLATIIARITNGLRLAAALDARLCQRAARGKDLTDSPMRMPATRAPRAAVQSVPPLAQPEPQPASPTEDPRLARLPTEAEIAARLATGLDPVVRRRPVGAVIVDICHDLGITPGQLDREFWDELCHAIVAYGGSLTGFLGKLDRRLFARAPGVVPDPLRPAAPPRLAEPATGPP
jgi:hypothetical protein